MKRGSQSLLSHAFQTIEQSFTAIAILHSYLFVDVTEKGMQCLLRQRRGFSHKRVEKGLHEDLDAALAKCGELLPASLFPLSFPSSEHR